jgi:prepilin-type N-terminal cleavage/methylation domain-containing protein
MQRQDASSGAGGFSLVELVVVVTIIGIITSIGVARVASSASGAEVAAFHQNWSEMTNAVDLYTAEHQLFPTAAAITQQLTQVTDLSGERFSPMVEAASGLIYGPYLRRIPEMSLGPHRGQNQIAAENGDAVGWLYFESHGQIVPNILGGDNKLDQDALDQLGTSRKAIENWADSAGLY